jgi:hypothetical protein
VEIEMNISTPQWDGQAKKIEHTSSFSSHFWMTPPHDLLYIWELKLYALFSDVFFIIIEIFNRPLLQGVHRLRMERAQKKGAEE